MKLIKNPFLIAVAAATVLSASASAATTVESGVGSSALFQSATIEAFQLANAAPKGTPCANAGNAGYYTAKNAGQIVDTRDKNIANQLGNWSVVWDSATAPTCVYSYLSVDSGVGNRAFFAKASLQQVVPVVAPSSSVINPAYFGGAAPVAIPAAVLAVLNNTVFTAVFTDITPADALYAENRTNCGTAATATLECLGYTTADQFVGTPIQSTVTAGTSAQPVAFNIFGNDPIVPTQAVPAFSIYPIGVAPVIFVANRTNTAGLGAVSGGVPVFSGFNFQGSPTLLFGGFNCDSSAFGVASAPLVAVTPILREPISGTMNTFDFTIMVPYWAQNSQKSGLFSQEGYLYPPYTMPSVSGGVTTYNNWGAIGSLATFPGVANPLNGGCPATGVSNGWAGGPQGNRIRAIGTGDEVSGILATTDSVGYLFFSYGNVSKLATPAAPLTAADFGYLTYGEWAGGSGGTLIPTDPINVSGKYGTPYTSPAAAPYLGHIVYPGNGELPVCTAPCPLPPNVSFPNVRSGAYLQWSLLRAAGSPTDTNLATWANGIANQANVTTPDFVPFVPTADGDNGIQFYRSHFSPAGVDARTLPVQYNATNTPNNGVSGTTGLYVPGTEAGGDVGGCVDWRFPPNGPTNLLNCRY